MKKDNWIYKVFFITFILAAIFSGISNLISEKFNNIILILIILLVTIIGIVFDMIGTSVLTAEEKNFHAKSSRKIKGAKESISIIKNNVRIANICNDIIGDICGIVSGGLGAVLAINLSNQFAFNLTLTTIIVSSIISSLTVGGKAFFKNIAAKKCDNIIMAVGKMLNIFKRK